MKEKRISQSEQFIDISLKPLTRNVSANDCTPQHVANGIMLATAPGDIIEVDCNPGYDIVGAFPRCVAGSTYSAALPICKGKYQKPKTLIVWVGET